MGTGVCGFGGGGGLTCGFWVVFEGGWGIYLVGTREGPVQSALRVGGHV